MPTKDELYDKEYLDILNNYYNSIKGDALKLHKTAIGLNWDSGIHMLNLIVNDPACDLATALQIFTDGEVEDFLENNPEYTELSGEDKQMHDMFTKIIKNVEDGFYKTSNFQFPTFDFDMDQAFENSQNLFKEGNIPFNLGKIFYTPIKGEEVDPYDYEGFPEEIDEKFNEIYDKYYT